MMRLLLLAAVLGILTRSGAGAGGLTCTGQRFSNIQMVGISDDGKTALIAVPNGFCVMDRTEMVNNTNKGLYCSNLGGKLGGATSLSNDGSMVSFSVGEEFACMIKTADLKSPESTSLARCMGWKTAGKPILSLSEDGSEGAFTSAVTGRWFLGAIAYDSIVQWSEQGLKSPSFSGYLPVGRMLYQTQNAPLISRDGSLAWTQTIKGEGRAAVIWDPWTGAYTNGSMKWAYDPVWGSGEKDEQYLFYVASLPGETTNVCALKKGGEAICSTFTLRPGYTHSSLISGFSLSGKPVAIVGLAKASEVSLVCTLPLGGGAAELTCVSGFNQFRFSAVTLPQPEVWVGLFDYNYLVDMATITENPLGKQSKRATQSGNFLLAGRVPVCLTVSGDFDYAACFGPLHMVS